MTTNAFEMNRVVESAPRSGIVTVTLWVVQVAAAAMFLMAGWSKLTSAPMMVHVFSTIGLGQWFRYLTGALEIGGALLLFVPAATPYAAIVLALVMVGAVIAHLFVLGGSPGVALALLVATTAIAFARRERISSRLVRN